MGLPSPCHPTLPALHLPQPHVLAFLGQLYLVVAGPYPAAVRPAHIWVLAYPAPESLYSTSQTILGGHEGLVPAHGTVWNVPLVQ